MKKVRDFYEVLGVSPDASPDDIRAAYKKLAVRYHPDKNPGDKQAEERFKELGQAYAILSDPGKRAQYDQQLRMGIPPDGDFAGGPGQGPWQSISVDEILRKFGFIFGDAPGGEGGGFEEAPFGAGGRVDFGGGFGPSGRGGRAVRRGEDVEASIRVPFRQAALGEEVEVSLRGPEGRRTLKVRIPEGTEDHATLRLRGQGQPGFGGGPPGDLFLRLEVEPDPTFRRRGNDVEADLPVPAPIAVLGGRVDVTTLRGTEGSVTIPPGTSSGMLLRLRGQGILGGDHLARVMVVVPRHPTDEERRLYRLLMAPLDGVRPNSSTNVTPP